jgi:RNA-splicing ligase RtcB
METVRIRETFIQPQKLDKVIRSEIPSGFDCRKNPHRYAKSIDLSKLCCAKHVSLDKAYCSIGTLGGGNHFIEANKDDEGNIYIVIHSGSRRLGKDVALYHQKMAFFTSHGISPNAKGIHMKTQWLERILSTAKECNLSVIGFDELP